LTWVLALPPAPPHVLLNYDFRAPRRGSRPSPRGSGPGVAGRAL